MVSIYMELQLRKFISMNDIQYVADMLQSLKYYNENIYYS